MSRGKFSNIHVLPRERTYVRKVRRGHDQSTFHITITHNLALNKCLQVILLLGNHEQLRLQDEGKFYITKNSTGWTESAYTQVGGFLQRRSVEKRPREGLQVTTLLLQQCRATTVTTVSGVLVINKELPAIVVTPPEPQRAIANIFQPYPLSLQTLPTVDFGRSSSCDVEGTASWHFNCYFGLGQGEVGVLDISPVAPGVAGLRSGGREVMHAPSDETTWGPRGWLRRELLTRTKILAVVGNVLYAHATVTENYLVGVMLRTAEQLVGVLRSSW